MVTSASNNATILSDNILLVHFPISFLHNFLRGFTSADETFDYISFSCLTYCNSNYENISSSSQIGIQKISFYRNDLNNYLINKFDSGTSLLILGY